LKNAKHIQGKVMITFDRNRTYSRKRLW